MMGVILHKGEGYYTYLYPIFEAMKNKQKDYNWLITECAEWYDIFAKYNCKRCDEYIWISGEELTKLVRENEHMQMIWGVLSGFDLKYSLDEVIQYPLPYADMNRRLWENPVAVQNPLASVEIVAFDSSCTVIKSIDTQLLDDIKQKYGSLDDLERYNSNVFDDNVAYEKWLENSKVDKEKSI